MTTEDSSEVPRECGICGDYSAQGVEVHADCLHRERAHLEEVLAELERLRAVEAAAQALIVDHKRYGYWRMPRRFKDIASALEKPEGET